MRENYFKWVFQSKDLRLQLRDILSASLFAILTFPALKVLPDQYELSWVYPSDLFFFSGIFHLSEMFTPQTCTQSGLSRPLTQEGANLDLDSL